MVTETAGMSLEALNKIIKEAQALTPDERRQLIERLAAEEQHLEEHYERRPESRSGDRQYSASESFIAARIDC